MFSNTRNLLYCFAKNSNNTKNTLIDKMMKAIRCHKNGGVEEMKYEDIPIPSIGKDNEVLIKNEFIGVNFIDTYHRSGLYKLEAPFQLGREGSGVVSAVGAGVTSFKVGDRVCYFSPNSYAQYTLVPQANVYAIPENVGFKEAAAYPLQGMTAQYLIKSTFKLDASHTCLIQAGAGGLGQLLIQMAKNVGATVITTVSNKEKEDIAKSMGADHVINYTEHPEFASIVKQLTKDGKGVDVVYDGVGKATWQQSMLSLKPLGMLCLVGNASGPVPPIDPLMLSANGSLFVTRATLFDYLREPGSLQARLKDVFDWVSQGKLKQTIQDIIPLQDAAKAHTILESRQTKGKVLLEPSKE
ncbi:hypothetical protein CYY_000707 [Polysphondylium violaceum]|uniref:Probable quinone oxidoreductase n=1 Tax=Polysphondylium violaceum TaxID=133409 RepID=A0A8J4V5B1_9MYCE|nr:hypothetical protein CYY_000707 [Polysphondylium violaceum]